jgi:hypothetical protein
MEFDAPLRVRIGKAVTTVWFREAGRCRSDIGCGRTVLWCRTEKHKWMPLDPQPDTEGIYTPHWGTCPRRAAFRRPRKTVPA